MAEGLPVRSIIETLEEGIQDEGVDEQEEGSEDEDEGAEDANCNAKLCKLELNNSVLEWCNTVHYASIHTIAFNVQIGRDGMILRWGKEP